MSSALDATIALVSSSTIGDYLGIASGSTEETQVDLMVNAASRWIMEYLDTSAIVMTTSITEYHDGDGTRLLTTWSRPIISVTSLHIDTAFAYGSDTLVSASDYLVYSAGYIKTIASIFLSWPQVAKIVYDAGYATIPADIQGACKELVRFWHERGTKDRVGMRSVSVAQTSTVYESDVPTFVKAVLEQYANWHGVIR